MNENTEIIDTAVELPKNWKPANWTEAEALDVSAALLSNPKEQCSARMRKNMKSLRTRVLLSVAPVVRAQPRRHLKVAPPFSFPTEYAFVEGCSKSDDVKLEGRLRQLNAKQLMKLEQRSRIRSAICERVAPKQKLPLRMKWFFERSGFLRNVASAARSELAERREKN